VSQRPQPSNAAAYGAGALLTVLVIWAYVALVVDDPPWGRDWRDGHFAIGMLVGAVASAFAVVILLRRPLPVAGFAWIAVLAFSGTVLALACWLTLIIRTVS
jgi:hypothetical protein